MIGPLPARAASATYTPDVAGVYLLPAQAAEDSSFIRTQVLTANGLYVNDSFDTLTSYSALLVSGGASSWLDPANTYMHSENKSWSATYSWNFAEDGLDTLQSLIAAKQVTVNVSAGLTADKHAHFGTHSSLTDRAQANIQYATHLSDSLGTSYLTALSLKNSENDPDGVSRTYTGSTRLSSLTDGELRFVMGSTDCSCGSSKVRSPYVYLSDVTAPTLNAAYVSDENGDKASRTSFKEGETAYLTLEMSEPIRFADGQAHDLELELALIDASTGQSSGQAITASLSSLTGSKLVFAYQVPAGMDDLVTTVSRNQDWMTGTYDLQLLDKDGSPLSLGDYSVTGLICDLAGNPLSWTSDLGLDASLGLDSAAPGYTRLTAEGSMIGGYKVGTDGEWPSDITPAATWAGQGDFLRFTLTIDEEIGLWKDGVYSALPAAQAPVKAQLNVKDSEGNPVWVALFQYSYTPDGVNAVRNSTVLTFYQYFFREEGMTIDESYGVGGRNPVRIVSLQTIDGSQLGDPAGNMLDYSTGDLLPAEKINLDTQGPDITFQEDNIITTPASTSSLYVTLPFTVEDGASGLPPTQTLSLDIEVPTSSSIYYCVTTNPDAPERGDSAYAQVSFQQPTYELPYSQEGQYYLHLYCPSVLGSASPEDGKVPVTVSITCQDYAGSQATATCSTRVSTDTTGPAISLPDAFTVSGAGEISVPFSVSDSSYLKSVTVQWNSDVGQNVLPADHASGSFSGTATLSDLTDSGSATLTVIAVDKADNSTTQNKTYAYNLDAANQYTLGSDPTVPTGAPHLTLLAPGNLGGSGSEGNPLITVAVVGNGAGSYNLYTVAGSGAGKDIFAATATADATVTSVTVEGRTVTLTGYQAGDGWDTARAYGTLPVTIFTLLESDWEDALTRGSQVTIASRSTVDSFAMEVLTSSDYTASFGTPQDSEGNEVPAALGSDSSDTVVQSLTGLRVPITLTSSRDASFALQDIDYSASYLVLTTDGGEVADSRQFFQAPEEGTTIYYPISVSLYGSRGRYQVVAHLSYLDGTTQDFTSPELYMDDAPAGEFYPLYLEQTITPSSLYDAVMVRRVDMDSGTTQLSLGPTGSKDIHLFFQSFDVYTSKAEDLSTRPATLEVWNETLGEYAVTFNPAIMADGLSVKTAADPSQASNDGLYLLEGENTIRYRAVLPNGNKTAVKTLTITLCTTAPTFDVTFTPDGAGGVRMQLTDLSEDAKEALALNGRTLSKSDSLNHLDIGDYTTTLTLDSNLGLNLTQEQLRAGWTGTNILLLQDIYGNFTYQYASPSQAVDIEAPRVSIYPDSSATPPVGCYTLTANIYDVYTNGDWSEGLDLSSFTLTFEYSDGKAQVVSLPELVPNTTWIGSGADYGGVYMIQVMGEQMDGKTTNLELLISGQFPYGSNGTVTVTLSCQDNMGYPCVDQGEYNHMSYTLNCTNTAEKPTVAVGEENGGLVGVTSDLPVRITSPAPTDTAGAFATAHTLPLYTGTSTLTFEDVFGKVYTQNIDVTPYGGKLTVSLSETETTAGPVTMTISVNSGYSLTSVTTANGVTPSIAGSVATLELAENDTVTIVTSDGASYEVPVTNIDTGVDPLTVAFYDGSGNPITDSSATSVVGPVTAALLCDELLLGETSHVFPIGSAAGDRYAFSVTDLVGNTATATATLPWAVTDAGGSTTPPPDSEPPQFQANLYVQRAGVWNQVNSFDSQIQTGELSLSSLPTALSSLSGQGVRVAFSIQDSSAVNVIVKTSEGAPSYTDASDSVEGLTVSGSAVTWTGAAASPDLWVYLVDEADNAAQPLTLTFPAVSAAAPTATVEYVTDNSSATPAVRAYLVPGPDAGNDFTVLDTAALTLDEDTSSSHYGQYYYTFTANGTYIFRFSDGAGNVGTVTATVNTLSGLALTVTARQWIVQGHAYTNETLWTEAQSSIHSNAPVTVILTTNLALDRVALSSEAAGVTWTVSANQAILSYAEACRESLTVTLTAKNGSTAEVILPRVTCIDTTPPDFYSVMQDSSYNGTVLNPDAEGVYQVDASGKDVAYIYFSAKEEVIVNNSGGFSTRPSQSFSKNGLYTLTFMDRAGNSTQVSLNVTGLPEDLVLSFSLSSDGSNPVSDPSTLAVSGGDTIYLLANQDVTAYLGTATAGTSVTGGSWTALTIPSAQGLVTLKAVSDATGETAYAYFYANLPDTTPPVITLPSQTVYAQAGITEAEGLALLQEEVTARDTVSGGVSFDVNTAGVSWDTAGSYSITYTARDGAGNTGTTSRTLVLTSQGLVTLKVNGQTAQPGATLTLRSGTAELTLDGMDAPVYLSLKEGYKTIPQMKLGAQVLLANDDYTAPLEIQLTGSGFHTLYLRAQDRTEYVFYLYVKG